MADKQRYQVRSACVLVPAITSDGEQLYTLYSGAVFEADPDNPRIVHNVNAGYIADIDAKATPGVDGAGVPVVDDERPDGTDIGAPVPLNDPGVVNEQAQADANAAADADAQSKADADAADKRAAAAAKLPADGSVPDGRAGKDVFVEYLARNGYSYDELVKQDKDELVKLAKQPS